MNTSFCRAQSKTAEPTKSLRKGERGEGGVRENKNVRDIVSQIIADFALYLRITLCWQFYLWPRLQWKSYFSALNEWYLCGNATFISQWCKFLVWWVSLNYTQKQYEYYRKTDIHRINFTWKTSCEVSFHVKFQVLCALTWTSTFSKRKKISISLQWTTHEFPLQCAFAKICKKTTEICSLNMRIRLPRIYFDHCIPRNLRWMHP